MKRQLQSNFSFNLVITFKNAERYETLITDKALVNIYFGEATVMGRLANREKDKLTISEYERDLKRTLSEILVDMAGWFGESTPDREFPSLLLLSRRLPRGQRPLPG